MSPSLWGLRAHDHRLGHRLHLRRVPIWGILFGLALGLERPTHWGVVVYGGFGRGGGTRILGDLLVVVARVC